MKLQKSNIQNPASSNPVSSTQNQASSPASQGSSAAARKCPVCGAERKLHSDQIMDLFLLWEQPEPGKDYLLLSMGERMFVEKLVKQYKYQTVYDAFVEACAEPDRMSLAYVRGILRGEVQKAAVSKAKAEAGRMAQSAKGIEKEGKIGDFDFSEILRKGQSAEGTEQVQEQVQEQEQVKPKREPIDREKAQREFEQNLKEKDRDEYERYMRNRKM
jgi:hypothetical protein